MSYATQQDLIDWCGISGDVELTALTDPANTSIDSLLVAKKLQQADNEINSRLVGVDLPMTNPYPPTLVMTACKIARALLYTTGRPEWVQADYDGAMQWLEDVRTGKSSLGLDSTGTVEIAQMPKCNVQANDVVFTADQLALL